MESIVNTLKESSIKFKIINVARLKQVKEDYENKISSGILSKKLYQGYLKEMVFDYKVIFPEAKSILITAFPIMHMETGFAYQGKTYSFIIPPAYSPFTNFGGYPPADLENLFRENNYRLINTFLPQKYLTVRSGLAKYGRNNISYIDEYGSYFFPDTFLTDMEYPEDEWSEFKIMDECSNCTKCLHACPTKALNEERFIINAPRCITFCTEKSGEIPDDIGKRISSCWIGCMNCQSVCPMNKGGNKNKCHMVDFTESETEFFLNSEEKEEFPQSIIEKLEKLYLLRYSDVLSRNLKLLIKNK